MRAHLAAVAMVLAARVLTGTGTAARLDAQSDPTARTVLVVEAWVRAVLTHTPGEADEALTWILERSRDDRAQIDLGMGLVLGSATRRPLIVRTPEERGLVMAGRMIADGIDFVHRAAILHADAAIEAGPGAVATLDLATGVGPDGMIAARDGDYVGIIQPNWHWAVGRRALDYLPAEVGVDPFVGRWYHATVAYMLRTGLYAEAQLQLDHSKTLLARDAQWHFDLACIWENRGLPRSQQLLSDEQIMRSRLQRSGPNARRLPGPGVAPNLEIPPADVANGEAERAFRRVLDLDPKFHESRARLARLLGVRGKHEDAEREALKVIASAEDPVVLFYAHLFAGRAATALGRLEEAAGHFRAARALSPEAQSALLAESRLALLAGDTEAVFRALEVLSDRTRPAADLYDPWWYYHMGVGREAERLMLQLYASVDR